MHLRFVTRFLCAASDPQANPAVFCLFYLFYKKMQFIYRIIFRYLRKSTYIAIANFNYKIFLYAYENDL